MSSRGSATERMRRSAIRGTLCFPGPDFRFYEASSDDKKKRQVLRLALALRQAQGRLSQARFALAQDDRGGIFLNDTRKTWKYAKVPQKAFEVLQPAKLSDLAALQPLSLMEKA